MTYTLKMWRHWSGWVQGESRRSHVHPGDAETKKIGKAGIRGGSRRNHVHPEDAETRKIGQAGFREGSRRNHVHAEDVENLVSPSSGKDRE